MLKRTAELEIFDLEQIRKRPTDYHRNLKVFEALYSEAKLLGVFPLNNPLEGIDVDIRVAKVLNARGINKKDRIGAR